MDPHSSDTNRTDNRPWLDHPKIKDSLRVNGWQAPDLATADAYRRTATQRTYEELVMEITGGQGGQPLPLDMLESVQAMNEEMQQVKADSRRRQIASAQAARKIIINC